MGFAADYDVTFPAERPPQGIDYVFQSTHATGPGDLMIRVRTVGGNDWTADARNGSPTRRSALSGLWSTPSPTRLCVVARGQAYLVDVGAPEGYSTLDTGGPVIQVKPAVADGLLLIASPWVVTALGEGGVLWRTERLAIDGLRLDEALGGRVAGVADPDDEEPRDFAIDLRTGAHEGGAFEHGVQG